MPIIPPPENAWQQARDVVRETLSRRALTSAFRLPKLAKADPGSLAIALPHRVRLLTGDELRSATISQEERAESWRFLIYGRRVSGPDDEGGRATGLEAIAAANAIRAGAGQFEFDGLNEGPFVGGTETAILQAEALDEVCKGEFEAVLLVVPAQYVVALWLQDRSGRTASGESGEADLVLPLPRSNPALDPGKAVTLASFREALRQAGRRPLVVGSKARVRPRRVQISVPLSRGWV